MRKLTEEKLQSERDRLEKMKEYEYRYESHVLVCGLDEAGRGPLAGPVAAGAVILPRDCEILFLNDSKKLSEKRREELFEEIKEKAVAYGVGVVGADRIDEINILQATYEAMRLAISSLGAEPEVLLNDAVTIPGIKLPQIPIIKGDGKSVSIAAASIMAKVTRDHMMEEYDKFISGIRIRQAQRLWDSRPYRSLKGTGPVSHSQTQLYKEFCGLIEKPAPDIAGIETYPAVIGIGG